MKFKEQFEIKYKDAVKAFRANDESATLKALVAVYQLFNSQYELKNDDSLHTKSMLLNWRDKFGSLIQTISKNGLSDSSVQKFFGNMIVPTYTPTNSNDISSSNDKGSTISTPTPKANPSSGIDMDGIFDNNTISKDGDGAKEEDKETPNIDPVKDDGTAKTETSPNETQDEDPKESLNEGENVSNNIETPSDVSNDNLNAPSFEPNSLESFIGQQHIVKIILKEIAIAKNKGVQHLDNILLLGGKGLGKTTLMRLIAQSLGVDFEWMDCSMFGSNEAAKAGLQKFFKNISMADSPVVIGLDEIHMLSAELQSCLLTLLESRVYISPPNRITGKIEKFSIPDFTFIGATTDDDKILNTIKDRCLRLTFQMKDYTPDELRLIYRNKVAALGLTITEEAISSAIPRSRGSIRYVDTFVNGFTRGLHDEFGNQVSNDITLDIVNKWFKENDYDEMGLKQKDIEILNALAESKDTPLGAQTLASRVGLDVKKYSSENEPYLIKIGFVSVTSRGRMLTEKAKEYLNRK